MPDNVSAAAIGIAFAAGGGESLEDHAVDKHYGNRRSAQAGRHQWLPADHHANQRCRGTTSIAFMRILVA